MKPYFIRIFLVLFLLSFEVFFGGFEAVSGGKYAIRKVVIDAGHGGHDSGCLGSSAKEKDMALAISLKLGKFIEENFSDVKVIYTRTTDEFVELHRRAEIANENNADLFICIHFNSGPKTAYGTETFVMGLHKTAENLATAKRENASILMEKNYNEKYDGFDPNSDEGNVIFTLIQNAFLDQSTEFASKVQKKFKDAARFDRGVKQAGFLVLYRTRMPSVLIECAFLTNPKEEQFMKTEEGQETIAKSIFSAFSEYKYQVEGKQAPKLNVSESTAKTKVEEKETPETLAEKAAKEEERKAKLEADAKLKEEAEKKEAARKAAIAKQKEDDERRRRQAAEFLAKEEAAKKQKEEAERKAREEAEKVKKTEAARLEAEANARIKEELKSNEEANLSPAESKAREEEERKAKEESDRKRQADIERLAKELNEKNAKEEAELRKKEEAEKSAKEASERKVKEEAARKESEAKLKSEEESKAKENTEKLAAERKAKEDDERKLREEADAKIAAEKAIIKTLTKEEKEYEALLKKKKELEIELERLKKEKEKPAVAVENKKPEPVEPKTPVERTKTNLVVGKPVFKVQILTSTTKLPFNSPKFTGLSQIGEYVVQGQYKYTSGETNDINKATELQSEIRGKGFADAFIVAFHEGERITIAKALEMLK